MLKTILITGATDGIGLATARKLVTLGHHVLLHGRSVDKLKKVEDELSTLGRVESFIADLSNLAEVKKLADLIIKKYQHIDVLINNAGVLNAPKPITAQGLDIRFVVNSISPYYLTQRLLPLFNKNGRVINLSSAAQSPVNLTDLVGVDYEMQPMSAYSQSKLAITQWSCFLAKSFANKGPAIIAVNPGSLLASKMVKEGFGIQGNDINIGADILVRLALSEEFVSDSGKYFDNDIGNFANPHPDACSEKKITETVSVIDEVLEQQNLF